MGVLWSMKTSPSKDTEHKNMHILKWKNGDHWQPFNAEWDREAHLNCEHFSFFIANSYQGSQRGSGGKRSCSEKSPFQSLFHGFLQGEVAPVFLQINVSSSHHCVPCPPTGLTAWVSVSHSRRQAVWKPTSRMSLSSFDNSDEDKSSPAG